MELTTIPQVVAALFSLFVYATDLEHFGVIDRKQSYAEQVRRGEKFTGDCDDFAVTAIELLRAIHVSAWPVTVVLPAIAGGGRHMIVGLKDPATGLVYALDNRYPGLRLMQMALTGSMYRVVPTGPLDVTSENFENTVYVTRLLLGRLNREPHLGP